MELAMNDCIERIRIDNTDVFLEQLGVGKGKITISDTYNHNYSYSWGGMGGTLMEFITHINGGYFAGKMLGDKSKFVIDVPKTFTAIRKFIATELELPWYKHPVFQKQMRRVLNNFQGECETAGSKEFFVSHFHGYFVADLDFFLIDDKYDRDAIQRNFNNISECWNLIESKESDEYLWLACLHGKLKKRLKTKQPNS